MWFLLGAIYIGLYVPFWKAILLGWIFAMAFTPLLDRIRSKLAVPRWKSAYGLVGTFVTFVIIMLTFFTVHVYSTIVRTLKEPGMAGSFADRWASVREKITAWLTSTKILPSAQIKSQIESTLATVTDEAKSTLTNLAQAMIAGAPMAVLHTLIFFLAFGVFLVGGAKIWALVKTRLKLSETAHAKYKNFEKMCSRALGAIFIVGITQSVLTVIGAAIAGYEALFAIFVMAFIFSLIPVVGAGAVPVILSLLAFLDGSTSEGVILIVTAVIVGTSDNILRAWLFSRAAHIHPALSLISLIGAIEVFGFVGVFVAPVLEQLVMSHFINPEESGVG